jgi:sugar-phosphatase
MRAILFDMDGLLIDSEPLWRAAERACFAEVGIWLSDAQCHETTGLRIDEVVEHWFATHGVNRLRDHPGDRPEPASAPSAIEVATRIVDSMIDRISREGQALEGAAAAVARCRARDVPVALVSSSPLRLIEATLARLDLTFDLVVSAEHETYGKPHPAAYLTAARELDVAPTACLVLEDSLNGVLAAKAARMRCIAVPTPASRSDPRFAIADHVIDSLASLDESILEAF